MKYSIGIIIISFLGVEAMAQQPHQKKPDSPAVIVQPPVPDRQSPRPPERAEFMPENLIRLQPEQVPPPLRKTLEEVKYKGWENGMLYRNTVNQQYMLELQTSREVTTYYFDEHGKPFDE